MTLKELEVGGSAVVTAVGGEGALRQHFLDMGVIPGARVTVVKLAPMGDPVELRIHGYELTLRLADAAQITVEPAPARAREEQKPKKRTPHPGLGEEIPPQGERRPPAPGDNAHLCPGGQPELRQDHPL